MSKRPVVIEDLLRFKLVSDPQMAPDGSRLLCGIKSTGDKFKSVNHLYTVTSEGKLTQLTQGEESASQGRWSPDGTAISFVSAREGGKSQIFLLPATGEACAITQLKEGAIGETAWSPNGEFIAFTYRETHPDFSEEGKKRRAEAGESTAPWITESVWYRLDGDGYFGEQRYRLYVLHVESKKVTMLCEADPSGNYSFDWSPDSSELAVIVSAEKFPFASPPNQQILRVKLDGSSSMLPGLPKGDKEAIKWSRCGKWLAYAGDVDEQDPWGTRNSKLYIVASEGGEPRCVTGHLDIDLGVATLSDTKEATFGAVIAWAPDSKSVFTQIGTKGETHIAKIEIESGEVTFVTSGPCSYSLGGLSKDASCCGSVYGNPTSVPELHWVDLVTGKTHAVTHLNAAWQEEVALAEPAEVWLTAEDGHPVHGWVLRPPGARPAEKLPAVLAIHGGPHAQYGWVFFHEFQVLAAAGYVVMFTNPRGSKGYGEAHCAAIAGDWGNKDWIDIQAATNWLKSQTEIDPKRLGVCGGSYGGYMTNWVIGHCHDYAAAITDRCVSNMVSMAGNSDFPFNKDGYFKGVAWGELDEIKELWRQSPIAYFQNVKTPTLVIHSEGDLRCNIEQGEQVFTALQQQGVPSRFVRYPSSTSHGMSRSGPADLRMHRLREMVQWFDRYLKGPVTGS